MKKLTFLLAVLLYHLPVLAQVDTAWVRRYNGPGNSSDYPHALAVDDSGNVYVTGQSAGSGTSYDYATIKYSPSGDTLWVRRYNDPGNDFDAANALALDGSGNLYVTGQSDATGANWDYATVKYSPAGETLWSRRYNGPGNAGDLASALAVDDSGNVYVTGRSRGSGTFDDYATIKYCPSGATLWVRRYNGPGNYDDGALALAVGDSGNLYVTGFSGGGATSTDFATIKYAPNGDTLWVRRYNDGGDYASALAVDNAGNVYVTGGSGVGTSDYATIKYAPNGDTLWVRRYKGPGNSDDYASALALDTAGNLYVTGSSWGSGTFNDYATIKYAPNGDELWVRRYNGPANDYDNASALAVDNSGNLYVTGNSYGGIGTYFDYATIKYVQYTCLAKPGDVTGEGSILLNDIVALINFRFKSGPAPTPLCRGDAKGDGSILLPDIVYLINRVFKSGPAPVKSKECCL